MARYSPGVPIIDGLTPIVWLSFWRSVQASNIEDLNQVNVDVELSPGRTGIDLTSGLFNGTSSEVFFDSNVAFEGDSVSFGGWFYVDVLGTDPRGMVYNSLTVSPFRSWLLLPMRTDNSRATVQLVTTGNNRTLIVANPNVIQQWHHIAGVLRSGRFYGYYDGQLITDVACSGNIVSGSTGLACGFDPNFTRFFEGMMSEVFVFSEGLSNDNILELYNRFPVGKGSRAGNVFQKSGSSFSIRSRIKPFFKRTVAASNARVAFAAVRSNQQLMSPAQLAEFGINSPSFPRVNSLGLDYELSSQNLYSSQNVGLAVEGVSLNFSSVAPISPPALVSITIQAFASISEFNMLFGLATIPADWIFRYFMSDMLSPGVTAANENPFIHLASRFATDDPDVNLFSLWNARFGDYTALVGNRVVFRMDNLHVPSGQVITRFLSNQLMS